MNTVQSTPIKAIETVYKDYKFRSRLEARWAVFFDKLNISYLYESEGFDINGMRYLPDFYLPDEDVYVEVKPSNDNNTVAKVYLAGPIGHTDGNWRDKLMYHGKNFWKQSRTVTGLAVVGPTIEDTGHGSYSHGYEREEVFNNCLSEIERTSLVFCWIDTIKTYGTLIELGYAKALKKVIYLGIAKDLWPEIRYWENNFPDDASKQGHNDLWFVMNTANRACFFDTALDAFTSYFPLQLTKANEKAYALSKALKRPVWLIEGTPGTVNNDYSTPYSVTVLDRGCILPGSTWGLHPRLGLSPLDAGYSYTETRFRVESALIAARQARFEFGESG